MRDNREKVKAMDSWPDLPEERKREIEAFYTPEQTECVGAMRFQSPSREAAHFQ